MYAATELIGIEMYHGRNQPTTWVNILGEPIPPERVDEIQLKYSMPPEKDQKAVLGNYWWVVRLRPIRGTKTRKYEYMVNKEYTYSRMSWDFTQHKTFQLSANRWYYEGPIDKTLSLCLYPYYQYCPGSDIDFRRCLIHLGLNRMQYMEESKELSLNPHCLNPTQRTGKKHKPHQAVQLLVHIGALQTLERSRTLQGALWTSTCKSFKRVTKTQRPR